MMKVKREKTEEQQKREIIDKLIRFGATFLAYEKEKTIKEKDLNYFKELERKYTPKVYIRKYTKGFGKFY